MGKQGLRKKLLQALSDEVVNMDEDKARETAQKVLDEGMNAYDAVMNGLAVGMEGEIFRGAETHQF
jgi:methanogenic corrinoid protein MtbC1